VKKNVTRVTGPDRQAVGQFAADIRATREKDFINNLQRKILVYSLGRGLQLSDELLLDEMRKSGVEHPERMFRSAGGLSNASLVIVRANFPAGAEPCGRSQIRAGDESVQGH